MARPGLLLLFLALAPCACCFSRTQTLMSPGWAQGVSGLALDKGHLSLGHRQGPGLWAVTAGGHLSLPPGTSSPTACLCIPQAPLSTDKCTAGGGVSCVFSITSAPLLMLLTPCACKAPSFLFPCRAAMPFLHICLFPPWPGFPSFAQASTSA